MRLDEITFFQKRTTEHVREARKKRGLIVRQSFQKSKKIGKIDCTTLNFYNPDFIEGHDRLKIGFAKNRMYFFPSDDVCDYRLIRIHKEYDDYKIVFSGKSNVDAKTFRREEGYEFKYDEECKGWYVEKEDSENARSNI